MKIGKQYLVLVKENGKDVFSIEIKKKKMIISGDIEKVTELLGNDSIFEINCKQKSPQKEDK